MSRVVFSKESFEYRKIIGSPAVFEGLEFDRCAFEGGSLAQYDDPDRGLVVRDVLLRRCRVGNVVLHGIRFEDLTVEHLANRSPVRLEGCLLRHVTLRGRLGEIAISGANRNLSAELQEKFGDVAQNFYQDVDWALDITEAEFASAGLSHVPGNLVRRDPETQVLIRKANALAANRETLPDYADIVVERATLSPYDSIVAAAPKRSKNFERYRDELLALRDLGIAE